MHVHSENVEVTETIRPGLLVRLEINSAAGLLNLDNIHIVLAGVTALRCNLRHAFLHALQLDLDAYLSIILADEKIVRLVVDEHGHFPALPDERRKDLPLENGLSDNPAHSALREI